MTPLAEFLLGATCTGFAVAGLFFLRFWVTTRDSLFLNFAAAFWLLALGRLALLLVEQGDEARTYVYWMRLLAFSLILVAIWRKNRSR